MLKLNGWLPVIVLPSFLLLLPIFWAACSREPVLEVDRLTIEKDTVWSGNILVKGDVLVSPGVTLTVEPGTVVKFRRIDEDSEHNLFEVDSPYYPQAELIIRGRLIAKGTAGDPIVFTSAEIDARPGDWGALNFLGSDGNVVEHARILCAYNGIHAHGSSIRVSNSEFVKNGVGISFKSEEETPGVPWFGKRSRLVITGNLLTRNKGGIGFRNSDAEISRNEVRDNKFFGIWPKEKVDATVSFNEVTGNKKGIFLYQTQGVRFERNNIHDNSDYNIAVAEAQDFAVDARRNWFGTIDREKIEEMIFDRRDDPALGEILIDPVLREPVQWEDSGG